MLSPTAGGLNLNPTATTTTKKKTALAFISTTVDAYFSVFAVEDYLNDYHPH